MTDITAGTILMVVYFVVGFALFALCNWIVNQTYPEQRQTAQITQTTSQQLTVIHSGSATKRSNRVA